MTFSLDLRTGLWVTIGAQILTITIVGILFVGLLTFVFSTILGWSYYGEKAAEYLFGTRIITPYRCLWVVAVFVGSVSSIEVVWNFADAMNGLMAIPNLIALIALSGVIAAETRAHSYELTGKGGPSTTENGTGEIKP
ncbi:MAG: hypothetical protein EOP84_32650 [Verrucomicrobiaceae bacterium]|nr:MAG: hypothetical protein EOP84_32650 [Verrucomicrobiaceae bacterium]